MKVQCDICNEQFSYKTKAIAARMLGAHKARAHHTPSKNQLTKKKSIKRKYKKRTTAPVNGVSEGIGVEPISLSHCPCCGARFYAGKGTL